MLNPTVNSEKTPKVLKRNGSSWFTSCLNHPAPTDSTLIQTHRCIKLSCAPPTVTWPYALPPQTISKQSSLPIAMKGQPRLLFFLPHLTLSLSFSLSPNTLPTFNANILSFFCHCSVSFFWLLVWSYCKYFQYSITVPKSLHSLPGGKQNSHLRFSCGAFSANIIAARPPPSAGPKTTHLSIPPFSHNVPFLLFFVQNLQTVGNLCLLI